ncbi:MAG: hypothetical protein KatS3mg078_2071 [Deltaproteobacteria bacterium]|jgi:hypothetical protein|nr:MAG: hypothetical protein KatS3mg078_2071 [Deltaproteobacteria bacterium]
MRSSLSFISVTRSGWLSFGFLICVCIRRYPLSLYFASLERSKISVKGTSWESPTNTASIFPFLSMIRVMVFFNSCDTWERVFPSSNVIISLGGILLLYSLDRFLSSLGLKPDVLPYIFSISNALLLCWIVVSRV